MNRILALVVLLACLTVRSDAPTNAVVHLAWDYAPSELSTNLTFKIWGTTNSLIPMTNWTVLTAVVGTNLTATVNVVPTHWWFTATASNMWGESEFSNTAETQGLPGVPQNLHLNGNSQGWFGEWFP